MYPRITTSFCKYRNRPDAACRLRNERKCRKCGLVLGYFETGDVCQRRRRMNGADTTGKGGAI
jgi:hypothetical protein